jgi:hypothetical protein
MFLFPFGILQNNTLACLNAVTIGIGLAAAAASTAAASDITSFIFILGILDCATRLHNLDKSPAMYFSNFLGLFDLFTPRKISDVDGNFIISNTRTSEHLFNWACVTLSHVFFYLINAMFLHLVILYIAFRTNIIIKLFYNLERRGIVHISRIEIDPRRFDFTPLNGFPMDLMHSDVTTQELDQYSMKWAIDNNLVSHSRSDVMPMKLNKASQLTLRTFTSGNKDGIHIANDLIVWLCLLDNVIEDFRFEPKHLEELISTLESDKRNKHVYLDVYKVGILDIYDRMQKKFVSSPLLTVFWQHTMNYLKSNMEETRMRKNNTSPCIKEYYRLRRDIGSVYMVLTLQNIIRPNNLPTWVYENERIQKLFQITVDQIDIYNDLTSIEKETRKGEISNLTLVLLRSDANLSLKNAIEKTIKTHNDLICDFAQLEKEILANELFMNEDILKMIHGLKCWIVGHVTWTSITGRNQEKSLLHF